MTDQRFHPWPPFDAPRTTTSPTTGERLALLEELLRGARPGWWRYELHPGELVQTHYGTPMVLLPPEDLDAALEEVLRLQCRENALRRSLEELYELSLLLTSQRDQASAVLLGVGEALKKAGPHVDQAVATLEGAQELGDALEALEPLRQAAAELEPGAIRPPTGAQVRGYLKELAEQSQNQDGNGDREELRGFLSGEYTRHKGGTSVANDTDKKGD